jgi:hypothetical protein
MDSYTTRTDQVTDAGTVDMGFHYAELTSPYIELSAAEFVFAADFNGPNPDDQILTIRNFSVGTLNWEISEAYSWLTVIPISGNSTGEPNDVTLSVDITGLSWGQYNCQLTVSDPCAYNNPQVVSLTLNISRRIYVDSSASTGGNGQTWPTAFKYLQDALGEPPSYGNEIWVAEGIYHPDDDDAHHPDGTGLKTDTFQLISGVLIYGGFPTSGGTWEARDPNRYESILSGDLNDDDDEVSDPCDLLSESTRAENSYHVVTGSGTDPNTILDGFTISDGNAETNGDWDGGGMYNYSGSPTVANCTFRNNSADRDGAGIYNDEYSYPTIVSCTFVGNAAFHGGGGVCNEYSDPTVDDCIFINNVVTDDMAGGGGMFNRYDSYPTVKNCTFKENRTSGSGGGMCNMESSPSVTDCTFSANTAVVYGGGMFNDDNDPIVTNCIFVGNISVVSCGGGIFNSIYANPKVTNCIFSGNSAGWCGGGMHNEWYVNSVLTNCTFSANSAVEFGGGISNWHDSVLTLTNCIVWDNTAISGQQIYDDGTSSETVNYSDVQGDWPGTGNIDEDPLFKDPNGPDAIAGTEDDNLEPGYGSPCIDAGDSNSVPALGSG